MPWVAIIERERAGCSRTQDKTYKHVFASARRLKVDAATFVAQNPAHPWADPGYHEFIVDISDVIGDGVNDGSIPLFHGRYGSLPVWQQQTDGSGSAFARGSFADPEDEQSAFTADVGLADDRWIVRLYDNDPGTTGVHVSSLEFDESPGNQTVYMKLFNPDDTPSATNAQDQKTVIGGKLMIFDFAAGVTTFGVKTDLAGEVLFKEGTEYRVIGPGGERAVVFRVFGRTIAPVVR